MKNGFKRRLDRAEVREALGTVEGAGYGFLAGAAASAALAAAVTSSVAVPVLVTVASSTTGAGIGYLRQRQKVHRDQGDDTSSSDELTGLRSDRLMAINKRVDPEDQDEA